MGTSFNNMLDLIAYFSNELKCVQYLEAQRWNGKPLCPHCGSEHYYRIKTRFKHHELKEYKDFYCKACMKKYSVTTGTIYERTKIPIRKWLMAIYLMNGSKSISSIQLSKRLGITQSTAWFMLHRLRNQLKEVNPLPLDGTIEVDETFVGGKAKNKHLDKKVKYSPGRNFIDKVPVIGFLQQGGIVRCFVVPDTRTPTLREKVYENVKFNSNLYTDDWNAYQNMKQFYNHVIINHGRKKYTNGTATTNSIEGFWSHCKRSIIGCYHYVSRKHTQSYFNEFSFRYNSRMLTDAEKMAAFFTQSLNTRMTYKMLTSS